MKFKLSTASWSYRNPDQIEALKSLGFTFDIDEDNQKIQYIEGEPEIEFNTIEELMGFIEDWGTLIVYEDEIQIYDGYIE